MRPAEYLGRRGWVDTGVQPGDGVQTYCDPLHPDHDAIGEAEALILQQARDAAEERKIWSTGYDAALIGLLNEDAHDKKPDDDHFSRLMNSNAALAALSADKKLEEYRQRFGDGGGAG